MTMMALVEEGSKEFKALYKRIYRSLNKEINLVEDIIRDNKEVFEPLYLEVLDDEEANFEEDYNNKTYDVIHVSDVDVVTSFEKSQKAMFLLQLLSNPVVLPHMNEETVLRNVLISANCSDITNTMQTPPPAQVDPAIELKQMELKLRQAQLESDMAIKIEKEKSERLRIQIANQDQLIKQAEGALKAKELDYKLAEMEANVENIVADSIQKYANANLANAKAGQSTKETEDSVEKLYEPK